MRMDGDPHVTGWGRLEAKPPGAERALEGYYQMASKGWATHQTLQAGTMPDLPQPPGGVTEGQTWAAGRQAGTMPDLPQPPGGVTEGQTWAAGWQAGTMSELPRPPRGVTEVQTQASDGYPPSLDSSTIQMPPLIDVPADVPLCPASMDYNLFAPQEDPFLVIPMPALPPKPWVSNPYPPETPGLHGLLDVEEVPRMTPKIPDLDQWLPTHDNDQTGRHLPPTNPSSFPKPRASPQTNHQPALTDSDSESDYDSGALELSLPDSHHDSRKSSQSLSDLESGTLDLPQSQSGSKKSSPSQSDWDLSSLNMPQSDSIEDFGSEKFDSDVGTDVLKLQRPESDSQNGFKLDLDTQSQLGTKKSSPSQSNWDLSSLNLPQSDSIEDFGSEKFHSDVGTDVLKLQQPESDSQNGFKLDLDTQSQSGSKKSSPSQSHWDLSSLNLPQSDSIEDFGAEKFDSDVGTDVLKLQQPESDSLNGIDTQFQSGYKKSSPSQSDWDLPSLNLPQSDSTEDFGAEKFNSDVGTDVLKLQLSESDSQNGFKFDMGTLELSRSDLVFGPKNSLKSQLGSEPQLESEVDSGYLNLPQSESYFDSGSLNLLNPVLDSGSLNLPQPESNKDCSYLALTQSISDFTSNLPPTESDVDSGALEMPQSESDYASLNLPKTKSSVDSGYLNLPKNKSDSDSLNLSELESSSLNLPNTKSDMDSGSLNLPQSESDMDSGSFNLPDFELQSGSLNIPQSESDSGFGFLNLLESELDSSSLNLPESELDSGSLNLPQSESDLDSVPLNLPVSKLDSGYVNLPMPESDLVSGFLNLPESELDSGSVNLPVSELGSGSLNLPKLEFDFNLSLPQSKSELDSGSLNLHESELDSGSLNMPESELDFGSLNMPLIKSDLDSGSLNLPQSESEFDSSSLNLPQSESGLNSLHLSKPDSELDSRSLNLPESDLESVPLNFPQSPSDLDSGSLNASKLESDFDSDLDSGSLILPQSVSDLAAIKGLQPNFTSAAVTWPLSESDLGFGKGRLPQCDLDSSITESAQLETNLEAIAYCPQPESSRLHSGLDHLSHSAVDWNFEYHHLPQARPYVAFDQSPLSDLEEEEEDDDELPEAETCLHPGISDLPESEFCDLPEAETSVNPGADDLPEAEACMDLCASELPESDTCLGQDFGELPEAESFVMRNVNELAEAETFMELDVGELTESEAGLRTDSDLVEADLTLLTGGDWSTSSLHCDLSFQTESNLSRHQSAQPVFCLPADLSLSKSFMPLDLLPQSESLQPTFLLPQVKSYMPTRSLPQSESDLNTDPLTQSESDMDNDPLTQSESALDDDPLTQTNSVLDDDPLTQSESDLHTVPLPQSESLLDTEPLLQSESVLDDDPLTQSESVLDDDPLTQTKSVLDDDPLPQSESVLNTDPLPQSETVLDNDPLPQSESVLDNDPLTQPESVLDTDPLTQSESVLNTDPLPQSETVLDNDPLPQSETVLDNDPLPQSETVLDNDPLPQSESVLDNDPLVQSESVLDTDPLLQSECDLNTDADQLPQSESGLNMDADQLPQSDSFLNTDADQLPQFESSLNMDADQLPRSESSLNTDSDQSPQSEPCLNVDDNHFPQTDSFQITVPESSDPKRLSALYRGHSTHYLLQSESSLASDQLPLIETCLETELEPFSISDLEFDYSIQNKALGSVPDHFHHSHPNVDHNTNHSNSNLDLEYDMWPLLYPCSDPDASLPKGSALVMPTDDQSGSYTDFYPDQFFQPNKDQLESCLEGNLWQELVSASCLHPVSDRLSLSESDREPISLSETFLAHDALDSGSSYSILDIGALDQFTSDQLSLQECPLTDNVDLLSLPDVGLSNETDFFCLSETFLACDQTVPQDLPGATDPDHLDHSVLAHDCDKIEILTQAAGSCNSKLPQDDLPASTIDRSIPFTTMNHLPLSDCSETDISGHLESWDLENPALVPSEGNPQSAEASSSAYLSDKLLNVESPISSEPDPLHLSETCVDPNLPELCLPQNIDQFHLDSTSVGPGDELSLLDDYLAFDNNQPLLPKSIGTPLSDEVSLSKPCLVGNQLLPLWLELLHEKQLSFPRSQAFLKGDGTSLSKPSILPISDTSVSENVETSMTDQLVPHEADPSPNNLGFSQVAHTSLSDGIVEEFPISQDQSLNRDDDVVLCRSFILSSSNNSIPEPLIKSMTGQLEPHLAPEDDQSQNILDSNAECSQVAIEEEFPISQDQTLNRDDSVALCRTSILSPSNNSVSELLTKSMTDQFEPHLAPEADQPPSSPSNSECGQVACTQAGSSGTIMEEFLIPWDWTPNQDRDFPLLDLDCGSNDYAQTPQGDKIDDFGDCFQLFSLDTPPDSPDPSPEADSVALSDDLLSLCDVFSQFQPNDQQNDHQIEPAYTTDHLSLLDEEFKVFQITNDDLSSLSTSNGQDNPNIEVDQTFFDVPGTCLEANPHSMSKLPSHVPDHLPGAKYDPDSFCLELLFEPGEGESSLNHIAINLHANQDPSFDVSKSSPVYNIGEEKTSLPFSFRGQLEPSCPSDVSIGSLSTECTSEAFEVTVPLPHFVEKNPLDLLEGSSENFQDTLFGKPHEPLPPDKSLHTETYDRDVLPRDSKALDVSNGIQKSSSPSDSLGTLLLAEAKPPRSSEGLERPPSPSPCDGAEDIILSRSDSPSENKSQDSASTPFSFGEGDPFLGLTLDGDSSCAGDELTRLRAVFDALDRDKDGFVKMEDFVQFATVYGAEQVKHLTGYLDPAGLGVINFRDFYRGISEIQNEDVDLHLYDMGYPSEGEPACSVDFDDLAAFEVTEVTDSAYVGSESAYSECETFTDEDSGGPAAQEDPEAETDGGGPPHNHHPSATPEGLELSLCDISVVTVTGQEEQFEDFGEGAEPDLFSNHCEDEPDGFNQTSSSPQRLTPSGAPVPDRQLLAPPPCSALAGLYCTQCHKHINRLEELSTRLRYLEMDSPDKRMSSRKEARRLHNSGYLEDSSEQPLTDTSYNDTDLTDKVLYLEQKVSELERDAATTSEQQNRLRQENLQLLHRAHALEEQLKDQELLSDEVQSEETRKHRDELRKMERDRAFRLSSLKARVQELENENTELRSQLPSAKATTQRLEEEKLKLLDEIEELQIQLKDHQDQNVKLSGQLSKEMHKQQSERERCQEVIEELRRELEQMQLIRLEMEQKMGLGNSAALQEYNSRTREAELEQEVRRLKEEQRLLKEQNEELNGQIINLSIQGAKNLFSTTFSDSLAAEISSVSRDELMEAIQKQEEINLRLQDYIDRIIVAIMETNPAILEVKFH